MIITMQAELLLNTEATTTKGTSNCSHSVPDTSYTYVVDMLTFSSTLYKHQNYDRSIRMAKFGDYSSGTTKMLLSDLIGMKYLRYSVRSL